MPQEDLTLAGHWLCKFLFATNKKIAARKADEALISIKARGVPKREQP